MTSTTVQPDHAPPRPRPRDATCVFVFGCDRSGTTLLMSLLDAHPDLALTYEAPLAVALRDVFARGGPHAVLDALAAFPQYAGLDRARLAAHLADIRAPALADVVALAASQRAHAAGKRIWGDKTPEYWRFIPQLAAMFPDARFVHIVRDPRQVARSWIACSWGPNTAWHAAHAWAAAVATARAALRTVPPPRWCEIRYEDLIAHPPDTLQRVCDCIGVPFDPAMLDPATRAQHRLPTADLERLHARRHQPLRAEPRSARPLPPRAQQLIEAVCRELMIHYGYAPVFHCPRSPGPLARTWYRLLNRLLGWRNRWRMRHAPRPRFPLPASVSSAPCTS